MFDYTFQFVFKGQVYVGKLDGSVPYRVIMNLDKPRGLALDISAGYQCILLYTTIDQTLVILLHRLLNYEIGGLDCHVIMLLGHVCIVYKRNTYLVIH